MRSLVLVLFAIAMPAVADPLQLASFGTLSGTVDAWIPTDGAAVTLKVPATLVPGARGKVSAVTYPDGANPCVFTSQLIDPSGTVVQQTTGGVGGAGTISLVANAGNPKHAPAVVQPNTTYTYLLLPVAATCQDPNGAHGVRIEFSQMHSQHSRRPS